MRWTFRARMAILYTIFALSISLYLATIYLPDLPPVAQEEVERGMMRSPLNLISR